MGGKTSLFNRLAPFYGLYFDWQVKNYRAILAGARGEFDLRDYGSVLDIGCGTGALCQVLQEYCPEVTGLDTAPAMLAIARKKTGPTGPDLAAISFVEGDVLAGLPFPDKSFDLAVSSYVAHGFQSPERRRLYAEMSRVARQAVVLFDYNGRRSWATNIVEWLEGGDYFNFIAVIRDELLTQFGNLQVIDTGPRSALYICRLVTPLDLR